MKKYNKGKVSVIIPAYNKAKLTVTAVQSVLSQSYENKECIVIDDDSTDNTLEALIPFSSDNNFYYMKHLENEGVSAARNTGIKEASGEYIALLDCDDEYLTHKLTISVSEMKRQNVDMIYNSIILNEDGINKRIHRPKKHNLLFKNYIVNSVMIKRKVFDKVGLFDKDLFICADWDMWLRIEEHFKIGYINMPLTIYRI